ncbi:MAG: Gfo/Idh/MocA family oxidoreductase [Betaproteobacteria bacterium]
MPDRLNVGVVGLGVMGQRMLERIKAHPRLRVALIWDANPDTLGLTRGLHPELQAAHSPEQLIASPGLHSLYVATPPAGHMALSNAAFDAGLAVLCEKPLTLDFDVARRTVRRIADQGHRAAVNFSLASSLGLATLLDNFGPAAPRPLGALRDVAITLEFAAWPRPWQTAAGQWLSMRTEGGFSREVLSHFIFVLQRVLGPAIVWESAVNFPVDGLSAETALKAELRAGNVTVHVKGKVDSAVGVADRNQMVWRATDGAIVLRDWYGLARARRGGAVEAIGDAHSLRLAGQALQLDQWVDLIEGRPNSLAGFDEALNVQETIESLLRAR